ncbi:unnamed protein product [Prunus armeniaca]|uniref:Uncharacterized protein n=1 Tax=Prunus armeniaca TaxID=36596 RepID=A0A6J5U8Y8_PRUAR|nr:unnamed protein product [Prunus armeniaca]
MLPGFMTGVYRPSLVVGVAAGLESQSYEMRLVTVRKSGACKTAGRDRVCWAVGIAEVLAAENVGEVEIMSAGFLRQGKHGWALGLRGGGQMLLVWNVKIVAVEVRL